MFHSDRNIESHMLRTSVGYNDNVIRYLTPVSEIIRQLITDKTSIKLKQLSCSLKRQFRQKAEC